VSTASLNSFFAALDPAPLNCFLKNATEFEQFLRSNLSLSDGVVKGILSSTIDRTQVGIASLIITKCKGREGPSAKVHTDPCVKR
jgi:hypothetical protein